MALDAFEIELAGHQDLADKELPFKTTEQK